LSVSPLPLASLGTVSPLTSLAPYYRNPRLEQVTRVPEGVKRVLDVGCGAGAFGSLVRSEHAAEIWGIELVPEVAGFARERLDRVYAGDALQVMPHLPAGYFDLITFNDVLEHLAWPWDALRETRRLLAPGGKVLASLPNLRLWKPLMRIMLDGDFPHEDSHTFDRTHLRWFTQKSIPRFFSESGFRVLSLEGIEERYSRTLRVLNLVTRNRLNDCRYLQFSILAEPDPNAVGNGPARNSAQ